MPRVEQRDIEEAVTDLRQLVIEARALLRAPDHVAEQAKVLHAVVAMQQLHQRVGVGDRRRFVAHHHQALLGGTHETQHRIRDAGRGVDQQHVHPGTDRAEGVDQPGVLEAARARPSTACRRMPDDADAAGPVEHDVLEAAFTGEHVGEVALGPQAQQHVHVGQPEVGIEQCTTRRPCAASAILEVDGDAGLADTALAAGDGDDLDRVKTVHPAKCS
jgi:hypothetical protein